MSRLSTNKYIKLFFFGNYFYAVCAVALSIEASLQQHYPLNNLLYYILAFSSTIVFYTNAYILTEVSDDIANIRSMWYARNKKFMQINQVFFFLITLLCAGLFLIRNFENFLVMNSVEWFLLFIFPISSGLYYGVDNKVLGKRNLRNVGWLKPFIIGFTWAGLVNIYPVLYSCIEDGTHFHPTFVGAFLFLKNFMFITILCILFDIKDYAMDYNAQLKTLVVKLGLRRTIFYFIIPLCFVGLGSFLIYAFLLHFSILKMLINTIPFVLIITVAYSMHSRRSIFYYLIIIDGLMLVKALCGITAMKLF
ncbi:hypothetical protein [Aurantibacillus circumpalustris]|uniref:hypothetical protein n=1 Tax=Aurantibacillus circumpalustris TaxID=3036359 RepID=UPI00295B6110|nr:hypothetical protein [Aurantibacillus circumpalustris]